MAPDLPDLRRDSFCGSLAFVELKDRDRAIIEQERKRQEGPEPTEEDVLLNPLVSQGRTGRECRG